MIFVACAPNAAGNSAGQPGILRIEGDSALGDLPQSLVNAYEAQTRAGAVTYQPVGRAQLLADIHSGAVDVAFLLHPPDDHSIFTTAVGYQPLVIITTDDLNVHNLSEGDVRAVISGRKANWADVGGPDLPIGTVLPFASTSERVALDALAMQNEPVSLSALLAANSSQTALLVNGSPGRVGIVSGNFIPQGLKALTINGAAVPYADQPRNTYPFITTIAFTAAAEPQGETKAFLDWVLSQDGQRIVSDYALPVN